MKHLAKNQKKKSNAGIVVLLIILAGGILFSGWKLYDILNEYREAKEEYASTSEEFIVANNGSSDGMVELSPAFIISDGEGESSGPVFQQTSLKWGYKVLFDEMWQTNTDVVAWIENTGTVIDYPVMHGATNDTYLHTTWKGTYNSSGSIFVNYRCSGLLDDYNTIVYGHNMKNGSMFHTLKDYASQSYYEEHPYFWYATPDATYVLYVMASYVATVDDTAYDYMWSEENVKSFLASARRYSDIDPNYIIDGMDADYIEETARRIVVLSTCSYEFNNARYVVITVPLLSVPN